MRAHAMEMVFLVEQVCGNNTAVGYGERCHSCPLGKTNGAMSARHGSEGAADLGPGGVAICVQDAGARVRGFTGTQKAAILLVEARAPFNKFVDAQWAFVDKHLPRGNVHSTISSCDGIVKVKLAL